MDTCDALRPAGEVLAEIDALLDQICRDRSRIDAGTRLGWVKLARRVRTRVEALAAALVGEADRAEASLLAAGTPLSSWLGMQENLSRREAAGSVQRARSLARHAAVGEAAVAGELGTGQALAIARALDELAPQLNSEQQSAAEQSFLRLAGQLDADQLAKACDRVLAEVVPEHADELLGTRLQREAEAAHRQRSLRFYRDGGSLRFEGSLPRVEGEQWMALIASRGEALRRTAVEARDPGYEIATPEQRRADALIALIRTARDAKTAPGIGAPRIVVTVDYERLRTDAAAAGAIGAGEALSAGELRRICCDAEIIPAVLGASCEVLDVGRGRRLASPAQRTALALRDRGCAFPGCGVSPPACEAHHIIPWWQGGRSDLANLVLLCHHHHGVVEPAKYSRRDQWEVRIGSDGHPEFLPPARIDRERRPLPAHGRAETHHERTG